MKNLFNICKFTDNIIIFKQKYLDKKKNYNIISSYFLEYYEFSKTFTFCFYIFLKNECEMFYITFKFTENILNIILVKCKYLVLKRCFIF